MKRTGILASLALLFVAVLCGQGAVAASLDWPERDYPYVAVEQDLRDVLQALGRNMAVGIKLTKNVQGTVRGRLPRMSPTKFLNHLCASHGLIWYFDGQVLEISSISEVVLRVIRLKKYSYQFLISTLEALDITDGRFPIRVSDENSVILVTGPRRYVELVEQTAKELEESRPRSVRVFRGSNGAGMSAAAFPLEGIGDLDRYPELDSLSGSSGAALMGLIGGTDQ
ncbi:secretin N-terminal domain-containing protein [Aestuariispira insulae]|uniref:Type III secretion protein C n=1 Tax=Aestuariispira insulae TaxID=1461337 RepID=A0A3D9H2F9_9PROT|nr:secretin N-terminal domain-containing protein [Aestuariispira insulae]RED43707.1 type III secretion protein C [Aestuariispira insulae]